MPERTLTRPTGRGFVDRYGAAFGRSKGMLLRMSGLLAGEVEGDGAWIVDETGRRWLDFGSFGLHLLGQRHPVIVAALSEQLGRLGLSGKILGNVASTRCAEALLAHTDPWLDRVVFANSGGEAVDAAVKLAALATGRGTFLALRGSYHGKTLGALALSDAVRPTGSLAPAVPVRFVEPGDASAVRAALVGGTVAAAVVEPVQGEGGIRPVDPQFLAEVRDLCAATGTLLVLDEIQTGLGRCGRVWRSADDVVPDILLVGKTLGGGMVPVAAAVFGSGVIGESAADPVVLASSYAGGALAGRVGAAVVTVVSDPAFLARVRALGEHTRAGLRDRLAGSAGVADVRGEGLMVGLETAGPGVAGHVVVEAAKRGLLVSFCLSRPAVVRVYPPAVCTDAELDEALDRLAEAVRSAPAA